MLYDPIYSIYDLYEANKADHIKIQDFFTAYVQLELSGEPDIIELDNEASRVVELSFILADNDYKAYAYKVNAEAS